MEKESSLRGYPLTDGSQHEGHSLSHRSGLGLGGGLSGCPGPQQGFAQPPTPLERANSHSSLNGGPFLCLCVPGLLS